VWRTVDEAAALLGINGRSVRKRIAARTLPAMRDGARWLVQVPEGRGPGPALAPEDRRTRPRSGPEDQGRAAALSPADQLATLRDQWLLPLVDRLTTAERTIGELTERVAAQAAENAGLREALTEFQREAMGTPQDAGNPPFWGSGGLWWPALVLLGAIMVFAVLVLGSRPA
jgi:excisionase family DNA binding protein